MGEGALRKNFVLPKGAEWTEDHAEAIEVFFQDVVDTHVTLKTGTYQGSARIQTVAVKDLPGPPKLLCVQPALGGAVALTLLPYSGGIVSAWTNKGFTLPAGSTVNAANVNYRYLILA